MAGKLRDSVQNRRNSYREVFKPGDATTAVLDDLKRFCRATTTPAVVSPQSGMVDPIATGIAIGRLEVFHRIAQHIHISDQDLYRIVGIQHEQGED